MRSSLASSWLLVVVVGVAAAGCGSVSSSNDGSMAGNGGSGGAAGSDGGVDTAPPTVAEACAQFGTAFCGRLQACAPFVGQVQYGDRTTCESRAALGCMLDLGVSDTNHTTTDMVACANDAASASCDDLIANKLPTSCQIKPGLRLDGQGCGSSWQCMSTHCEKSNGDCGVCAPRAAASGACTVDEGCQMGLVCSSQKCVTPGALNASCSTMAPCQANLYCSATSNSCATPLGAGASCAGNTNGCDFKNGIACNTLIANPKCETVAAAKGGEACGLINGTLTVCIAGNSCPGISLVPVSLTGVCPNPAGDGQACDDKVHCLGPASCVNGLCRLPSAASCAR